MPTSQSGWHREDIKAAINKRFGSAAAFCRRQHLNRTAVSACLARPWPAMEARIAEALDIAPQAIWPERYDTDGQPRRPALPVRRAA